LTYFSGGFYIVLAGVLAAILHPRTRLLILGEKKLKLLVGSVIFLVIISPLIIGIISQLVSGNSSSFREIFALNGQFSLANLATLASAVFGFSGGCAGNFLTPIITLAGLLLAVFGLIRFAIDIISARSHMFFAIFITALMLSIANTAFIFLLFVPLAIALSAGIFSLLGIWYKLFPINPYARIFALIPLVVLIFGIGWTNVSRFVGENNYNSSVVYNYNLEFSAARAEISQNSGNATLIVAENQKYFYEILMWDFDKLKIEHKIPADFASNSSTDSLLVLNSSTVKIENNPQKIVTSSRKNDAVLLRIYRTNIDKI
jgi:MFS family permease